MNATVTSSIPIKSHSVQEHSGQEFISFDVPNGWDDVKKISRKVLKFDGREFVFSGWNSDENYCCFYRMLDHSTKTAKFATR